MFTVSFREETGQSIGTVKYGSDATFQIDDRGVLIVEEEDGSRTQFSPSYWCTVQDKPAPAAAPRRLR